MIWVRAQGTQVPASALVLHAERLQELLHIDAIPEAHILLRLDLPADDRCMGLLINLLIALLICGVVYWIITLIPLPPPFQRIALVILLLIFLLWLLNMLGVMPAWHARG